LWAQNNDRLFSGIAAFTPDSRLIATGDTDGKVRLRQARTGKVKRVLAMGQAIPIPLAFAADGKTLACACSDNSIRLWDTATYREPEVIPVETIVGDIAFAPTSRLLAGLTRDGRLCLWDVRQRQLKATVEILGVTRNKQGFTVSLYQGAL
jgi:WD40 repeat protein